MNTTRLLRPLRSNVFQVILRDRVAAVLRVVSATAIEIWTLADTPRLLVTLMDPTGLSIDPAHVAVRLADGEFDNDFGYEIDKNPDPDQPSALYFVTRYGLPSQRVLESFTTDDPGREVEAAREVQAIPDIEERWAVYAERGL